MILAVAGEVTGSVVAAQEMRRRRLRGVSRGVAGQVVMENSRSSGWLAGWLVSKRFIYSFDFTKLGEISSPLGYF